MKTPRIPTLKRLTCQLDSLQAKAKVRLLSHDDLAFARDAFKTLMRYCAKTGLEQPELHMDGGAVANSYDYKADATHVRFAIDAETKCVAVSITRTWARRRSGGGGGQLRLHVVKRDDDMRKWADLPAFRFGKNDYHFRKDGYLYL